MIISCCSAAALQVGTPLHNDYTNRVRYSCQFKWTCKEQSDEQYRRGSSAEEEVNTDAPVEAKSEWAYTGIVGGFWTPPKWHCRNDMWTCEPSGSDDKWVFLVSLAQGRCTVVLWGSQSWPKTGLAAYRPRCGFAALGYMQCKACFADTIEFHILMYGMPCLLANSLVLCSIDQYYIL